MKEQNKDKEKKKDKGYLQTLPAVISLTAALVVSIVMLVNKKNSLTALIAVFAFLVGFYIVGLMFRGLLLAVATKEPEEDKKDEENTEKENLESDTK